MARDLTEAARLFRVAAEKGSPAGQAQLGFAFENGVAIYLRKPSNCTGYRNDREREKFFGVCVEPKGITFERSKERTVWLARRYGELEAEALRNWGSGSGNAACAATGGTWSGAGCYSPAGRPCDPHSGRCTGGASYPC